MALWRKSRFSTGRADLDLGFSHVAIIVVRLVMIGGPCFEHWTKKAARPNAIMQRVDAHVAWCYQGKGNVVGVCMQAGHMEEGFPDSWSCGAAGKIESRLCRGFWYAVGYEGCCTNLILLQWNPGAGNLENGLFSDEGKDGCVRIDHKILLWQQVEFRTSRVQASNPKVIIQWRRHV
jgi:hypothetical protein